MLIGICDDNIQELNQYKIFLSQLGYNNIAIFHSGEELIQKMPKLDLLFLDIRMNGISGIEVKNLLEEKNWKTYIVFYTSHIENMQQCFGEYVIGFVYKPIILSSIKFYINKVSLKLEQNYPLILDNGNNISSDYIIYIQSDHNYTLLHQTNSEYIIVRKSLKQWQNELSNHGFIIIHRSYLVNLQHICYIDKSFVVLTNGHRLSISRTLLTQVKEIFQTYKLKSHSNHPPIQHNLI